MNVFDFMRATRPQRARQNLAGQVFGGLFGGGIFGGPFMQQPGFGVLQAEALRRQQEEMFRHQQAGECAEGRHRMQPIHTPTPGHYHPERCVRCGHTEEVLEAEYTQAALPPKE